MKTKNFILSILVLSLALSFSCSKKEEEVLPEPDAREIITGKWLCTEYKVGESEGYSFTVTIAKMADTSNGLFMDNFALLNGRVLGYLIGDHVEIPSQTVNSFLIEGEGFIKSDYTSNWGYTTIHQGDTIEYVASFKPN